MIAFLVTVAAVAVMLFVIGAGKQFSRRLGGMSFLLSGYNGDRRILWSLMSILLERILLMPISSVYVVVKVYFIVAFLQNIWYNFSIKPYLLLGDTWDCGKTIVSEESAGF